MSAEELRTAKSAIAYRTAACHNVSVAFALAFSSSYFHLHHYRSIEKELSDGIFIRDVIQQRYLPPEL